MTITSRRNAVIIAVAAVFVLVSIVSVFRITNQSAYAACTALPTDRGVVTATVSVPTAGTYRVWSRIKTPDTTNKTFLMQVDQSGDAYCSVNVGGGSIAANTWTWVDWYGGNTSQKNNMTLSAGTHTVKLAGNADNVMVDRIILTQSTTCTPTGTGDNCADSTPPTAAISSPANGASISSTTNIVANVTDNIAVTKVEFTVDGTVRHTANSSPWQYAFNPTNFSIGSHTLTVTAYDAAGNSTVSASRSITIPDTVAPTVSITSPVNGAVISSTTTVTASASDNIGVTKVEFYVDNILKSTDNNSPYQYSLNPSLYANGSHAIKAIAYDAANNSKTSAVINVTINNPVIPTYLSADINQDAKVNLTDLSILSANYNRTGAAISPARADINGDNKVNLTDLSILSSQYGKTP